MSEERIGLVLNYRLGMRRQYSNQCLIKIPEADPSEAMQLIGCKVGWPANNPKIYGKIVKPHGKKGILRVRFKKGLPGQALNTYVKIIR